ncbi:HNH endonuclease, partial [Porticoccaceae bacterium]|nr:HNH endonuclease [Porticoccaceae bacterium]
CGRLVFDTHEEGTSKPVHMLFHNIDYDDHTTNDDLIDIYLWKPSKAGRETQSKINRQGVITPNRARKYRKPNETERKGLVTSRVGQGYYRQKIIERWEGKCPVSGMSIIPILIASHIVPWSQSNDEEKLDVNNGILLSPNVDALFDKCLISFKNDGSILISGKISIEDRVALGLNHTIKIPVSERMTPYLERHRKKFEKI